MATLTVTAKGQVTLKKEVLQHMGVKPGDRIEVDLLPEGRVAVRAAAERKGKMSDFFGLFPNEEGLHFTIEEINDAIAEAWAGKR